MMAAENLVVCSGSVFLSGSTACGTPNSMAVPTLTQPDISFLPAGQRRRLSSLSRVSLHLAYRSASDFFTKLCLDNGKETSVSVPFALKQLPCVFGSRHGESEATLSLFDEILRDEVLSPLVFSRSVHNTGVGLFSIAQGVTAACCALSALKKTASAALLEAAVISIKDNCPVLCVVADEQLPDFYSCYFKDDNRYQGVGLVICPNTLMEREVLPFIELMNGVDSCTTLGGELTWLVAALGSQLNDGASHGSC